MIAAVMKTESAAARKRMKLTILAVIARRFRNLLLATMRP